MKVEVLRESLVAGLDTATRAGKSKPILPVLGMVLLDAYQGSGGGILKLMCTDLNVSLEHRIEARVEVEGRIAVPHRLLHELSVAMPSGQITLETEDETVTLRMSNNDGSNRSSIKGLDAGEFPTILREARASITMPTCGPFLDAVRQTSFAAEQKEGSPRHILEGVLVAIKGEQITLVAADGFRMATREIVVPGIERDKIKDEWLAVVPSRSLAHLLMVKNVDDPLTIAILNNDRLAFECGPIRMTTNVVEGKYFAWEGVLPGHSTLTASFDVKAMRRAVRSMAVFGRAFAKPTIRVTINPDGQIVVEGENQEMGDGQAVMDAEVEGETPLATAMNANFLDDALKSVGLDHGAARIEATVSTAPVLIRPDGDGEHLKHVIMPSVIHSM